MQIDNFLDDEFYRAIQKAYEYNYVCGLVVNQIREPAKGNNVYSASDIFDEQKSIKQIYLDSKLEGYATQRNKFFSVVLDAFQEETIEKELQKIKNVVIDMFNAYYKTNKKFEEVFDKDSILDKTLYDSFYMTNNTRDDSPEFEELAMAVSTYIQAFSKYKHYVTALDILNTLNNDFNKNGYKSFYYGIPQSRDVHKLSGDVLNEAINFTLKENASKFKAANKLEKKLRKQEQVDLESEEYQKYSDLSGELMILELLSIYLTALSDRYASSTKPDFNKIDVLKLKLADLSLGVNPFKKNKTTDFIYVHKLELEDILSLLLALENTEELVKKISENTEYELPVELNNESQKEQ